MSQTRKTSKHDDALLDLRGQLWPDAHQEVFAPSTHGTVGYARMPRVVPMLASLLNEFDRNNCGALYVVLWSHDRGHAFVPVDDLESLAIEAGYTPTRARRAWKERVTLLREWNVIRTAPKSANEHGYILLRNPYRVALELKESRAISNVWWSTFEERCRKAGVVLAELRTQIARGAAR
jgi:hypothetical protein